MSVLQVCVLLVVFSPLPTLYTPTFPQFYTPISVVFFRSKLWKTSAETGGFHDTLSKLYCFFQLLMFIQVYFMV